MKYNIYKKTKNGRTLLRSNATAYDAGYYKKQRDIEIEETEISDTLISTLIIAICFIGSIVLIALPHCS